MSSQFTERRSLDRCVSPSFSYSNMNHSLRKIQLNENKTAVAKMPCNWLNLYLLLSKQSCEVINLAPSLLYD